MSDFHVRHRGLREMQLAFYLKFESLVWTGPNKHPGRNVGKLLLSAADLAKIK